jgi:hypothetical protein
MILQAGTIHQGSDAVGIILLQAAHQMDAKSDDLAVSKRALGPLFQLIEQKVLRSLFGSIMTARQTNGIDGEITPYGQNTPRLLESALSGAHRAIG